MVDRIVEAAAVDQSVDEDEVDELADTLVDTAAADAERHAAAVKIQAIHRGGVGRRIALGVKRANEDDDEDDDEAAPADPVRRAEMELELLMSPDLEPLPEPESSVDELTGELHQTSRSALEEATRFAEDLANEAEDLNDDLNDDDDDEGDGEEMGSEIDGVVVQRDPDLPSSVSRELDEEESFEYAAMRYDGGEVAAPVAAVYSPKRREPKRMFKPKKSAAQRRLERLGIKKPEEDEPESEVISDANAVLGTANELAERRRLMAENFERLISGQDAFILEDELLGGHSPTFQPTQYRPSPTKQRIPIYQDPERDAEISVELRARERELVWRREKREREEKALEAERRRFEVLKRELEEIESRRRDQTYEKERRKEEEMELRKMRMENRRLERQVANDRAELDGRHAAPVGNRRLPHDNNGDRPDVGRHKNAPLFKRMEKAYHFNVEMEIERERKEVLEKRRAKMYGAKPGLSYAQLQVSREQEAKTPTWQKGKSGQGVPPGGLPPIRSSVESLGDGPGHRMTRFERLRREEKARARREEIAKYELADRKRRYGEQVRKEYKPHVSEKARAQLLKRKDVARPGFEEYHAESLDALSPGAAGEDATPALPRIVPNREVAHERGQEVFFEYDVHGRKVLVDPYEEHDMNSPFRPQRPGAKLAPSPRRPRQKPTPREEPLIKNQARRPAPDQNVRHSQEMTPAEHLERLGEERHRLERELLSVEYTYRNGRLVGRPVQRQSFGSPVATARVPSRGHPSWPESAGTDGYVGGGEFIPQDYIPQAAFDEIPVGGRNAVGNGGGGVLSETAVNRHAAREDQERKKGKGFRTMLRERQLAAVEARMSHEQTPTPPPRPKPEFANRPAPRRHPPPPPPRRPPAARRDARRPGAHPRGARGDHRQRGPRRRAAAERTSQSAFVQRGVRRVADAKAQTTDGTGGAAAVTHAAAGDHRHRGSRRCTSDRRERGGARGELGGQAGYVAGQLRGYPSARRGGGGCESASRGGRGEAREAQRRRRGRHARRGDARGCGYVTARRRHRRRGDRR